MRIVIIAISLSVVLGGLEAVPKTTFGEGTFMIGVDIAAGTYRARSTGRSCYWARLSGLGGRLSDTIAKELGNGQMLVTISPSDYAFKTEGCTRWTPVARGRGFVGDHGFTNEFQNYLLQKAQEQGNINEEYAESHSNLAESPPDYKSLYGDWNDAKYREVPLPHTGPPGKTPSSHSAADKDLPQTESVRANSLAMLLDLYRQYGEARKALDTIEAQGKRDIAALNAEAPDHADYKLGAGGKAKLRLKAAALGFAGIRARYSQMRDAPFNRAKAEFQQRKQLLSDKYSEAIQRGEARIEALSKAIEHMVMIASVTNAMIAATSSDYKARLEHSPDAPSTFEPFRGAAQEMRFAAKDLGPVGNGGVAQKTTFGEGTFIVGIDIAAGTYRASSAARSCYWARLSGLGGGLSDTIANELGNGQMLVTISPSDHAFKTEGCTRWTLVGSATSSIRYQEP